MEFSILEKIISSVIIHNGKDSITKFIWHGGEPLLAGLDFYMKVVDFQNNFKKDGYRILNAIQTNLTLLNDEFIDFCQKQNIQTVPQLGVIKAFEKYTTLQEIKVASDVPSLNHKVAEGKVYKSINKNHPNSNTYCCS